MAHELEIQSNGEAAMAYTNKVPWHGLGYRVDGDTIKSVKAMMKAAKLDWIVRKAPIFDENGKEIAGHFQLKRDKDNRTFDIVGNAYKPIQNADAFEFFTEFLDRGDATMETAGSLKNGKYVWGLARLGETFKLKGNDVVNGYLLVGVPHEQGKSVIFKSTSVRVVCNNTLTMALSEHRHSHRSALDEEGLRFAKEKLGIAREQFAEFEATARTLQKKTMSEDDIVRVLAPIFAPKAEVKDLVSAHADGDLKNRMGILMDVLHNAPGAQPDNAWGVLNAVTYYADHVASRSADRRLTQAWFGKTANQKLETMKVLLAA